MQMNVDNFTIIMNSSFLSEFRPSRTCCLLVKCCSKTTPKRSGNLSNLEPWQKDRLETAFIEGKRKTKISHLSNELKLTRSEVLTWFKDFEAIPEDVRSSILESLEDRKKLDEELQEHFEGVRLSKQQRKESRARHKRMKEEGELPWKPLNQAKLQALRKVRQITYRPSDEMLKILYDFYRIPKRQAVEWFEKERRKRKR